MSRERVRRRDMRSIVTVCGVKEDSLDAMEKSGSGVDVEDAFSLAGVSPIG